jgi:polar amino acid transport system substrate-binding protein
MTAFRRAVSPRTRALPRVRLAVTMVACLLLAAACGSKVETGGTSGNALEEAKKAKSVEVGFANERPYAYDDNGKLVGQAPAISGYIFEQLGGIQLKQRLFDFGSLIPALNSGRVDVVTAGMFITPERCKQALFGNPEYIAKTALLVKKGNPKGMSNLDAVAKDKGVKLAVMNGAAEGDEAKAAGIPESQIQIVADQQGGLDAVKSGRADAFALTSISLRALVKADSSVELTEPFIPVVNGKEQFGVGAAVFNKGDVELRDAYNAELKKLIESGKWLELVEPYGFTKAEMPAADSTADEYCKG